MSSHYIYLTCPKPDCTTTSSVYTGNLEADGFERALDYEGETITARCDEHAGWVAEPTPEPTWEYGFEAPMYGLMYVTTNELLVETMHAARPEAVLYRRPTTEWTPTNDGAAS